MATWTFEHEDGTVCPVSLDCPRSHAAIDTAHESHAGECAGWLMVRMGGHDTFVGVDAYADACQLAHRLGAETFDYGHSASECVSHMTYAPHRESGYTTARITPVRDYWRGL